MLIGGGNREEAHASYFLIFFEEQGNHLEVISTAVPLNNVAKVFGSAVELIDLVSVLMAQPE